MSHTGAYQTTFTPISRAMSARLRELAPEAMKRMSAFGLADRRDSAWALLLAPLAPVAGWLLLGWSAGTVLACLLINLAIALIDDLWKILRAEGDHADLQRECLEDSFVWPVAMARAQRRDAVYSKNLPTLDQLDAPDSTRQPIVLLPLVALTAVGLILPILSLMGDASPDVDGVIVGALPSLLLFAIANALQATRHHVHWRRAGSVRIATVVWNAVLIIVIAMISLALIDSEDPGAAAVLASAAVIGVGAWRLGRLRRLKLAMVWLAQVELRSPPATVPTS